MAANRGRNLLYIQIIMFIDSHCHLHYFDQHEITDIMANAKVSGLKKMLNVCTRISDIPAMLDIYKNFNSPQCEIFSSLGIHPNECLNFTTNPTDTIKQFEQTFIQTISQHDHIIAIGETGLDYYHNTADLETIKKIQKEFFIWQINFANHHNMPLIIHTREAEDDTYQILKHHAKTTIIMHCFTGSKNLMLQTLDLGAYISISGIVTFKNAQNLQELLPLIPLNRLLIETDCPYLAPIPMRGKKNQPAFITHTADFIANILDKSLQEICTLTTQNFNKIFGLPL